jgi:ribulose-5-phosphate 4-epimerase/fuculose-1-phosphate aldolase
VIYCLFPQAQACYHVHSVEANLVSRFAREDKLSLPPLEMLKGLGIWDRKSSSIYAGFYQLSRCAENCRRNRK